MKKDDDFTVTLIVSIITGISLGVLFWIVLILLEPSKKPAAESHTPAGAYVYGDTKNYRMCEVVAWSIFRCRFEEATCFVYDYYGTQGASMSCVPK